MQSSRTKQLQFWLKILGAIGVAGIVIWRILPPSPTYLSYAEFTGRDSNYYARVADACDLLIRATSGNVNHRHNYAGADEVLPKVLHDLRATRVEVASGFIYKDDTNELHSFVFIAMGQTRMGYGISWSPGDLAPVDFKWQLSVANEGGRKVLFERAATGLTNEVTNQK